MLVYRTDFVYLIRMHSLKFGTELALNKTLPANIAKTSLDTAQNQPQPFFNQTSDVAVYVRDEWEVGRYLFNAGIR